MTFDEVVAIGKEKLIEYEPRLNVKGQRTYSTLANDSLQEAYQCSLSTVNKEDIQSMVSSVLNGLVNLRDGFVMSEPPDGLIPSPSAGRGVAAHKLLNLLFTYEYAAKTDKRILTVLCWYYPAESLKDQ